MSSAVIKLVKVVSYEYFITYLFEKQQDTQQPFCTLSYGYAEEILCDSKYKVSIIKLKFCS